METTLASIEEVVIKVINENNGTTYTVPEIRKMNFEEIGYDSLDITELIFSLESELKINVADSVSNRMFSDYGIGKFIDDVFASHTNQGKK